MNFNPRSPGGERRGRILGHGFPVGISIHAPRVGSDARTLRILSSDRSNFNPRSPGGERLVAADDRDSTIHFNPRSPGGERLWFVALLAASKVFQSTLPGWGATIDGSLERDRRAISIHAPRVGSDDLEGQAADHACDISIHAPRVGSDPLMQMSGWFDAFQSTLPGWGATLFYRPQSGGASISIHAPRVGSDASQWHFHALSMLISIHAPRVGSDPDQLPAKIGNN